MAMSLFSMDKSWKHSNWRALPGNEALHPYPWTMQLFGLRRWAKWTWAQISPLLFIGTCLHGKRSSPTCRVWGTGEIKASRQGVKCFCAVGYSAHAHLTDFTYLFIHLISFTIPEFDKIVFNYILLLGLWSCSCCTQLITVSILLCFLVYVYKGVVGWTVKCNLPFTRLPELPWTKWGSNHER